MPVVQKVSPGKQDDFQSICHLQISGSETMLRNSWGKVCSSGFLWDSNLRGWDRAILEIWSAELNKRTTFNHRTFSVRWSNEITYGHVLPQALDQQVKGIPKKYNPYSNVLRSCAFLSHRPEKSTERDSISESNNPRPSQPTGRWQWRTQYKTLER
jgi:hypothetical protein